MREGEREREELTLEGRRNIIEVYIEELNKIKANHSRVMGDSIWHHTICYGEWK